MKPRTNPIRILLAVLGILLACMGLALVPACKSPPTPGDEPSGGGPSGGPDWPTVLTYLQDFDQLLADAEFVATEDPPLAREISKLRDHSRQAIAAVEAIVSGASSDAAGVVTLLNAAQRAIDAVEDPGARTRLRVGLVVLRRGLELAGVTVAAAPDGSLWIAYRGRVPI